MGLEGVRGEFGVAPVESVPAELGLPRVFCDCGHRPTDWIATLSVLCMGTSWGLLPKQSQRRAEVLEDEMADANFEEEERSRGDRMSACSRDLLCTGRNLTSGNPSRCCRGHFRRDAGNGRPKIGRVQAIGDQSRG